MKKQLQLFSLISIVVLFTGVIFKVMHWPGAAVIITLGAFTGILFLVFLLSSGSISIGTEKNSILLGSIAMIIVLAAFVFKIMHWPGANVMIILAHIGLLISSIVIFYDGYKETDNSKKNMKLFYSFTIFILMIILLYLAFVTDATKIS